MHAILSPTVFAGVVLTALDISEFSGLEKVGTVALLLGAVLILWRLSREESEQIRALYEDAIEERDKRLKEKDDIIAAKDAALKLQEQALRERRKGGPGG